MQIQLCTGRMWGYSQLDNDNIQRKVLGQNVTLFYIVSTEWVLNDQGLDYNKQITVQSFKLINPNVPKENTLPLV